MYYLQGAGGNGNVLKEIVDPLGARITLRNLPVGDPTLSVLELWGAEYQENNAFLVHPGVSGLELVQKIALRENCPVSAVGVVTGDGCVVAVAADGSTPFYMPLSLVLGKMPQKEFYFSTPTRTLFPLHFPGDITAAAALDRVLRLVDVGSKRFLTNKVDRSVTGLIAQQQCVGPLHTPLADVAVLAQTHFSTTGVAVAVGEQPIKGLISNAAQARLTVCEALSNLVFADITQLSDVKASCNWMWPAKVMESGVVSDTAGSASNNSSAAVNMEGAKMYQACAAIRDCMQTLGVGIDGGKDSLTMAAKVKSVKITVINGCN
jgi:phosphoribosylformylglycinamidine synthase